MRVRHKSKCLFRGKIHEFYPGYVYVCPFCKGSKKVCSAVQVRKLDDPTGVDMSLDPVFEKREYNCTFCYGMGRVDYFEYLTKQKAWER